MKTLLKTFNSIVDYHQLEISSVMDGDEGTFNSIVDYPLGWLVFKLFCLTSSFNSIVDYQAVKVLIFAGTTKLSIL